MIHSETLGELATALAAAQGEFEAVAKTATNPFFKSSYSPLPEVVKAASPILAKHGLAVSQLIGHDATGDVLTTLLLHKSGEFIADTMQMHTVKNDPQAQGSATTYSRRYAYMAVLNLVSDDDDDGNSASSGEARPGRTSDGISASEPQLKFLQKLIKEKKATPTQLNFMLIEVGAKDVKVEEGWTAKLTGGKQGTASGLIDYLTSRPLPDTDHPSDLAGYGEPPALDDPGPQDVPFDVGEQAA